MDRGIEPDALGMKFEGADRGGQYGKRLKRDVDAAMPLMRIYAQDLRHPDQARKILKALEKDREVRYQSRRHATLP